MRLIRMLIFRDKIAVCAEIKELLSNADDVSFFSEITRLYYSEARLQSLAISSNIPGKASVHTHSMSP
jgi:hypothetical protein